MCLIFVAVDAHPKYRIVIAANRDEFYDRPTAPASFWPEAPELLGGRDLRAGGTWIGITRNGRIAALTNFREDLKTIRVDAPSRGKLVSDFLLCGESPETYLDRLSREANRYNGFTLLVGEGTEFCCYSNRGNGILKLFPGIHGLSNHLLDTPWPKVVKGKQVLNGLLAKEELSMEELFHFLLDRIVAPDESLPNTGVDREWERTLSPIFIVSPNYGTRSSTAILLDRYGNVTFMERTFDQGIMEGSSAVKHAFRLEREP